MHVVPDLAIDAPGRRTRPVPRAVVLVEAGPDRSADVLAYLLEYELDRAAVPASVEVFTTGTTLPAYHLAALAAARRIEVGTSVIAPQGVVVARTAAEAAARARNGQAGGRAGGDTRIRRSGDHRPCEADGARRSGGRGVRRRGDRGRARDGHGGAVRGALAGRDHCVAGRAAPRRPATPVGGRRDGGAGVRRWSGRRPEPVRRKSRRRLVEAHRSATHRCRTCGRAPDTDPFHGPLRVPLLAPLLDPTAPGADEPDYRPPDPTPIRPVPALPVTGRNQEAAREVESVEATSRTGRVEARRVRSAEPADPLPSLDRAASSRRASSPTFRPAGGDGTPTTSRPARPGRSRPSWRRAARVRRVRRIRAGRARVGRLGRRATGVGGRLAVR